MGDRAKIKEYLSPLYPVVYDAFEAATQHTQEFFAMRGEDIDPFLAPHLVRYFAKRRLRELDALVSDIQTEDVANNGLSLQVGPCRVRIWKSLDGNLPNPNGSKAKDAFLRQMPVGTHGMEQMTFDLPGNPVEQLNLAILWFVTPTYQLAELRLVCPKADPTGVADIEAEWWETIPHPATATGTPAVAAGPAVYAAPALQFEPLDSETDDDAADAHDVGDGTLDKP